LLVVVCDYSGNVNEQDLTLSLGDTVEILERNGGMTWHRFAMVLRLTPYLDWFRGRINQRGDQRLGLFPANHICLQPCQVRSMFDHTLTCHELTFSSQVVGTGPQQHVVPKQDPLIIEVSYPRARQLAMLMSFGL
jgi:hypothetical protein